MTDASRRAWFVSAVVALAVSPVARASDSPPEVEASSRDRGKAECLAAYDAGQLKRAERRLLEARGHLLRCAAMTCPVAMQRECAAWLADVEAALPTVVVRGRIGSGTDTAEVRVLVDGEELVRRLDGTALAVDPGERRFRFEHEGFAAIERRLVIHEGDKLRPIEVDFSPNARSEGSRPLWPMLVLGGLGVAGIVTFTVLGATGVSEYESLQDTCAPRCPKSDSDALKTRFLVADIALGVGLAAAGGFLTLWLTRPRPRAAPNSPNTTSASARTAASVRAVVVPTDGGALGAARVRF